MRGGGNRSSSRTPEARRVRVFITGAGGQLGHELLTAFGHHEVTAVDHATLDVADRDAVHAAIAVARPQVVVHAAAWTAVDACEGDPERARRANTEGTANIAAAARDQHGVYFSTDYVFDGTKPDPTSRAHAESAVELREVEVGRRAALGADDTIVVSRGCADGTETTWSRPSCASRRAQHAAVRRRPAQQPPSPTTRLGQRPVVDGGQALPRDQSGRGELVEFAQCVLTAAGLDPARLAIARRPHAAAGARPPIRCSPTTLAGIPLPDFRAAASAHTGMSAWRVRVVVVNYNGGDLTVDCLRRLGAARWRRSSRRSSTTRQTTTSNAVHAGSRS